MSNTNLITFDRVVRFIAGAALIAAIVWLINILKNVLLPFAVACLIAYMLEPLVGLNQRWMRMKGRVLPVFVTLLEVTVVIGAVAWFCVPSVVGEVQDLQKLLKLSAKSNLNTPYLPHEVQIYVTKYLNEKNLTDLLEGGHLTVLLDKGGSLLSSTIDFLMHTLEWLLTFIYIIFVMLDYNRLMKGFRLLVPPKLRPIAYRVGDDIKNSMNRYFRSQALIASCAAVFYCIGFSIVGIPMAIVLGILVGVLYMIPYFQYITLIPVTAVCLISSMTGQGHFWSLLGQCALVYLVSQVICDYILTPKIMGKTMGLNPAIILLSLSVWGTLMGLVGMIIALPLTTLLLAYYKEFVIERQETPADREEAKQLLDSFTGEE